MTEILVTISKPVYEYFERGDCFLAGCSPALAPGASVAIVGISTLPRLNPPRTPALAGGARDDIENGN
ncbi:MAG TPA: hypothetical protein VK249_02520 [Anaerolineales bacterium]|nr:hypothetical protein [Anaerolineales bacterium]